MLELSLSDVSSQSLELRQSLQRQAGVRLTDCCQCGKCTGGCPMAAYMDVNPRQIVRYLQLGQVDVALAAKTPWICAACHACSCRCPQGLDLAALMEAVRQEAKCQGKIAVKEVDLFARLFLQTVKMFGRSHEILLSGLFNVRSGHLLQDLLYAPGLYLKGKIHILPRRVQDRASVRRLFARTKNANKK